jgi:adenine C2-methylase RlmN of 23S rRNA A2503 and tRNA A37
MNEHPPDAATVFRPLVFDDRTTGALDISVAGRRVISVPTQLGCRVGCTFCVSAKTPVVRNLRADEMLSLIQVCLDAEPADGRPIEVSFTGEGEGLLNHRQTARVCDALPTLSPDIDAVRYSFSGIGASTLLRKVSVDPFSPRIQFSLHAARQCVRDRIIPRSEPLAVIGKSLRAHAARFSAIELNVVLQDGVNDSDDDLEALVEWGEADWPILLNPQLGAGREIVASQTGYFADQLRASGRRVRVYHRIAAGISRRGIYPLLTARQFPQAGG